MLSCNDDRTVTTLLTTPGKSVTENDEQATNEICYIQSLLRHLNYNHDRATNFFTTDYNSALYAIGYCLLTSQATFSSISHTPTSQPFSSESYPVLSSSSLY